MVAGFLGCLKSGHAFVPVDTEMPAARLMDIVSQLGAPLLAATVPLPEALRGFSEYRQMVFGAMLVILMLVRPEGLFGSVNFKYIGQRLSLKKSKRGGGSHV